LAHLLDRLAGPLPHGDQQSVQQKKVIAA